jgi:hypothetical protein
VVAAAVAAAALSCHPEPGLGTLTYVRRGQQHLLDLANCRDRIWKPNASRPRPLTSPDGRFVATVVVKRHGDLGSLGYTHGYHGHRSWWLDTRYL